jgi:CxxC motif-containing protein (DUF1111 family)
MSLRSYAQRLAPTPYHLPLLAALVTALATCDRDMPTEPAPGNEPPPLAADLTAAAPVGGPLAGLTLAQLVKFQQGRGVFETEFTPEQGLGPLFNATGCAGCHEVPVTGGGGSNDPEEEGEDIEVHATALVFGGCDDLAAEGGQVFQKQATPALQALGTDAEPVPAAATATGERTTGDLFGFGLLDAVPDAQILALADPRDRNGDGISGRPNRTRDGRLGRFGRKAQVATLREFSAEAFVMEMGITNPEFETEQTVNGKSFDCEPSPDCVDPTPEPEINQDALDAVDAFVRLLAPPRGLPLTLRGVAGQYYFSAIGCAGCHVPTLRTGYSPVSALSHKAVQAYTDLLLHDMGPDLADICLGGARPSEFRTEPLMGLRFATAFLHDGRAHTIEEAIQLHGGEGAGSRRRWNALPRYLRAAVLEYIGRL